MGKEKSDFLTGPILPSLLKFSIPVLLALILQALYGAVDLWAVGKFGTTQDISAVATGSQAMQIITGLITGLSMGSTVLLGINVGRKDHESAAKITASSIWIFGILGLVLSIITVLLAPWIARITNAPPHAFNQTVSYIRICGAGSIFIVAYNLIAAIFRGLGDAKSPLYFVIIACITNIIGDVTLTKFIPLGASGAAIATILAQAVSVVLSLMLVKKKGLPFKMEKSHLNFNRDVSMSILKTGSPIALQSMCNEISYLVLLGFVNTLGEIASAGVGIAEKLVMFILLIPTSYMQSISAFVAQNDGANQLARAKKGMWQGMGSAIILGGLLAYFSYFHGVVLSTLFIKDGEIAVLNASSEFLKATSIECFILSIAYCFIGYLNGAEKTKFVMIQGLLSIFLVKIPYAWFASTRANPSLFKIGLSTVWAALFTLLFCTFYYFYSNKRDNAREEK